jgi:beta-glucosidase
MLTRVRGQAGNFTRKRGAMGTWAVVAAIGVLIGGAIVRLRTPDPPHSYARVRSTLIQDYAPARQAHRGTPVVHPRPTSVAGAPSHRPPDPISRTCPWVTESRTHARSPAALAAEVVARMTVEQKIGFVALAQDSPVESANRGIPSLCVPPLTLTDGPNGVGYGATGVTQLPAAIGVAASFDPAVAYATGQVAGAEARGKGLDVVQGPELNLARVPQSGRTFEAYGEDPYLAGAVGAANVDGIQSQHVMAEAKHFTVYNQETDRVGLNQAVSARALAEIYDAPFEAAVQQAHVGSVMCSYGSLNGTNICSDPSLYELLQSWGFNGFVRSDLDAVRDPAAAFGAGLDLIKPISLTLLTSLVDTGAIPMASLNAAVAHTLTAMFAFGLITSPRAPTMHANVASAGHSDVARRAAEESMVLLKNRGGVLPLTPAIRSVAVIGSDAGPQATTSGRGSSQVRPSTVSTPVSALEAALGESTRITYTPADSPRLSLPPIPAEDLVGTPLPTQTPIAGRSGGPYGPSRANASTSDLHVDVAPNVTRSAATASSPGVGPGWSSWSAVLRVPVSGTYEFSIEQDGDTWLNLDGQTLIASPGLHSRSLWSTTASLVAGHGYHLSVEWFAVARQPMPQLGFADVSPEIAAATKAARHASVAVIFAGVSQSEGVDRPSLYLPGDADALISSVAAVNRRTVVVLNTGGAVLMPWIDHVAAVLEAWYPGQADGTATAAVLDGQVDPSGHLPLTFPAVSNPGPVGTSAQFPGVDATVGYNEGLDIGYRWYQANGATPLFPFGFGLSYTSFTLTGASIHMVGNQVIAEVTVTNAGRRAGMAVVQAYLHYPQAAGEPPEQLRAFSPVAVGPAQSQVVRLTLPVSAFEADINGSEQVVPGTYSVDIGQSSADLPIHLSTTAP